MQPLPEKDFINESYKQDPAPFWFWLITLTSLVAILWSGYSWYAQTIAKEYKDNPFLQVTNREMSLFLWQEPELMRINAPAKSAYMPAFQYIDKVSIDPPFADDYVIAPPEVLFRYHTWNRLVANEIPLRHINPEEFRQFLNYAEEWQPQNWPKAPPNYAATIQSNNLDNLPTQVKIAFQGWKNYLLEGDAINALTPTYLNLQQLINNYPHYAHNLWRNITQHQYPTPSNSNTTIPQNHLPPFLRVALYNFLHKDSTTTPQTGGSAPSTPAKGAYPF